MKNKSNHETGYDRLKTAENGSNCHARNSLPIYILLVSMRRIKNNMNIRINIRICGRADTTLSTIIIGDGRAAEQIPHDAQGRFFMEDGTVFQAYYFSDDTISKW